MTDSHIGKTVYVAQALPATNDTTGFEALTWVQVKGVQTLPQLGVSHSMIDIEDLQTGFTSAVKGAASGVDTTATFRNIDADPGQVDVQEQAIDAAGPISVKLGTGTGAAQALQTGDVVEYAQGIAHSYQPNQGSTSSSEGFSVGFRQNDFTVVGTEPA